MDWDAIGAIGEVLGAAAVVASLLYLAKQTRTNTKAVIMQSGREAGLHFSKFYQEIARDPELMRVMNKAAQVPMADYTPEEWNQWNMFAKSFFHAIEAHYISKEMGLGFSEQDEGYLRGTRTAIATWPAWKKFFEEESATGFWSERLIRELSGDDTGSMEGVRTLRNE